MTHEIREEWTAVATAGEVVEATPAIANVHGAEIAIFNVDGAYFAISNICTHVFARLSGGYLDGFVIACPIHLGLFDIRNGKCQGGPVDVDLVSYDVRVVDGRIEVRLRS